MADYDVVRAYLGGQYDSPQVSMEVVRTVGHDVEARLVAQLVLDTGDVVTARTEVLKFTIDPPKAKP